MNKCTKRREGDQLILHSGLPAESQLIMALDATVKACTHFRHTCSLGPMHVVGLDTSSMSPNWLVIAPSILFWWLPTFRQAYIVALLVVLVVELAVEVDF